MTGEPTTSHSPMTRAGGARRAAARVAFFAILAAALVAAAGFAAPPATAGPYVNPSPDEIREKLRGAALARGIPPKILFAIAYRESAWRQFDANGDPLIGFDGLGLGLMQVTSYGSYDVERLRTDVDYNIAAGADILAVKWGYAPTVIPLIGDGDPRCYENWFYAVWAYNGWTAYNEYPYQVWQHVATGPEGWWTGVPVTPVPREWLVDGLGVSVPTPLSAHWWSPVPLPKPVLGAPRVPKRVAAGARLTVMGTLAPQHPAGAGSVEIRCYRYDGASWVYRKTRLATNKDYGGVTRYEARFGLGSRGRWRLVAYAPADAEHAAVTSASSHVTVRIGS